MGGRQRLFPDYAERPWGIGSGFGLFGVRGASLRLGDRENLAAVVVGRRGCESSGWLDQGTLDLKIAGAAEGIVGAFPIKGLGLWAWRFLEGCDPRSRGILEM